MELDLVSPFSSNRQGSDSDNSDTIPITNLPLSFLEDSEISQGPEDPSITARPTSHLPLIRRSEDVASRKANEVIDNIQSIYKEILKIFYSQKVIGEKLWWKKISTVTEVKSTLAAWADEVSKGGVKLSTDKSKLDGLWKDIHAIPENNLIPGVLKNLQYIDFPLDLLRQNSTRMLTVLQSKGFGEAFVWYKHVVSSCVAAVGAATGKLQVQALIDLFDGTISKIKFESLESLKREVQTEIRKFYIEAIRVFLQAMKHVKSKVLTDVQNKQADWTTMEQRLSPAVLPKTDLKEQPLLYRLQEGLEKPSIVPAKTATKPEIAQIAAKGSLKGSFYMNSHSYTDTFRWMGGYDKDTWEVIGSMQEKVAKVILGLYEEAEECLKNLVSNNLLEKPPGDEQRSNIKKYYELCNRLGTKLEKLKTKLFGQDLTELTIKAVDYAAGLSKTIEELRHSLELLEAFWAKDKNLDQIFIAQKDLFSYLEPSTVAPNSIEHSLRAIESFNFASIGFKYIQEGKQSLQTVAQSQKKQNLTVSAFMEKTTDVIQRTLAEKQPSILEFTDEENKVWHCITGKEILANLLYTGESDEGLPAVVRSYIEKRITKLLYFSEKNSYDQEIAILLFILSKDKRYVKEWTYSMKNHLEFSKIIESYRTSKNNKNNPDESLVAITEILFFVYKSLQKDKRDPLAYGRAYQLLFDFYFRYEKSDRTGIMNSFIAIAHKKLCDAAAKQQYSKIHEGKGFNQEESRLTLKELNVSNSYTDPVKTLYRALGCCIWGENLKQREKSHQIVKQLFETEALKTCLKKEQEQEINDVKEMICENAIQKILGVDGSFAPVEKIELETLIKGPIQKYLTTNHFELKDPRILFVLVHLVTNDNEEIIQEMINAMGEDDFAEWKSNVQQFVSGWDQKRSGSTDSKVAVKSVKKTI